MKGLYGRREIKDPMQATTPTHTHTRERDTFHQMVIVKYTSDFFSWTTAFSKLRQETDYLDMRFVLQHRLEKSVVLPRLSPTRAYESLLYYLPFFPSPPWTLLSRQTMYVCMYVWYVQYSLLHKFPHQIPHRYLSHLLSVISKYSQPA